MTTIRSPRRRGDDGRRAELVEAASRVVAREGIAAASTRRIAEEAGVPSGLVHYWFAGKDELLQEVLAATLAAIEAAATRPAGQGGEGVKGGEGDVGGEGPEAGAGLFDRLRAAFRVIEEDDRGRQLSLYEMTTWSLRKPGLAHVAGQQYAAYRRVATDGVSGWLEATGTELPADVRVAGQFVAVLFDGLVLSWLADPEHTDVDGVLRFACTLIEHATGPVRAAAMPDGAKRPADPG